MSNYALELVKGYDTVYPYNGGETAAGGYVKQSKLANPSRFNVPAKGGRYESTDEVGLAQEAAEQGHQIFFLPETQDQGKANPDVIIDGDLADIKHVFKTGKNAIQDRIKSARKQGATTVLLQIADDESLERIESQLDFSFRNHEHLQKVIYKWRGQWYTRTR